MTKSQSVKVCPSCDYVLTPKDTERCPSCGVRLIKPTSEIITQPSYISAQVAKLNKAVTGTSASKANQEKEIRSESARFYSQMGNQEKIYAMDDALQILRHAISSKESTDTLRKLTRYGKSIGKLAQAIEEFSKSGGVINESESTSTRFEPSDQYN